MAQTDFRSGYIIKSAGDTIYGEVDFRGDMRMGSVCKFRKSDGIVDEYSPKDIIAYRFIEGKYFVSKVVESKSVFLEYLLNGTVSVYYLRDGSGEHYYLEKEGIGLEEIPYEHEIRAEGNKQYDYNSTKHMGLLYVYMQDAPSIQNKIKAIKSPQHNNLIKLAENYHNAVCDGTECVIYEKKQPLLKINPEILGGGYAINFKENKFDESKITYLFNMGLLGHIWLPRASEKLYLKTGIIYSNLNLEDESRTIYKIPIQIEYVYPSKLISPKLAYGINIYSSLFVPQSVSFSGGTNIKLNKLVSLSVTAELDFAPDYLLFIPNEMLSYGVNAGIYFTF